MEDAILDRSIRLHATTKRAATRHELWATLFLLKSH